MESTQKYLVLKLQKQISLKVFDLLGQEVAQILNEFTKAGEHEVYFNASDLPSGVFFYRIHTGDFIEVKKMILIK